MKSMLLIALLLISHLVSCQDMSYSKMNIGIGSGIDFGGFGIRYTYKPIHKLGVFGAGGYNLNDFGYNLGAQYTIHNAGKISMYTTIMYGYNTVLIVQTTTESKTTYYGPSVGVGMNYTLAKSEKSFLSLELLLPIRPSSYKNVVDTLKSLDYDIKDQRPILLSIGYHFKILNKK